MKQLIAAMAAVIFFGFVDAASAADMPVKAPMAAPVAFYNWTGFYVGGHIGGGWTKASESLAAGPATPLFGPLLIPCGLANAAGTCGTNLSGIIGGGQIGYNLQRGNWVFGVEASYSGADVKGSDIRPQGDVYATTIRSLLMLTGRLGYAWDRVLVYGKGGYAGGSVRFTQILPVVGDNLDTTEWHNGWVVGAGVEYALMQNWVLGAEYNYVDLGNKGQPVVGSLSGNVDTVNVNLKGMHTVLARLSYKFDWMR